MNAISRTLLATCLVGVCLHPARAAVDVRLPHNIVIANLSEHGDLLFILYEDRDIERGFVIDPKSILPGQEYHLRPSREGSDNPGPPIGQLSMIGVPRKLMEERKNKPDPKWLKDGGVTGIVPISGVLHNVHVEKSSALHSYRLEKTEQGLELKLMNPDVLTRYPAEDLSGSGPERKKEGESDGVPQLVLIGTLALSLVGVLVWRMKARGKS